MTWLQVVLEGLMSGGSRLVRGQAKVSHWSVRVKGERLVYLVNFKEAISVERRKSGDSSNPQPPISSSADRPSTRCLAVTGAVTLVTKANSVSPDGFSLHNIIQSYLVS